MSVPALQRAPWTQEDIEGASELYRSGLSFAKIAEIFGTTKDSVVGIAFRNRPLFPKRNSITAVKKRQPKERKRPKPVVCAPRFYIDRVVRVTFSGVKVTMPRVPFIDGYAQQAAGGE
jgi:hypothetical protein